MLALTESEGALHRAVRAGGGPRINDDGVGIPDGGTLLPGNGMTGMRERAAAAGGELEAGPRPEGGFRVRTRLPTGGAS